MKRRYQVELSLYEVEDNDEGEDGESTIQDQMVLRFGYNQGAMQEFFDAVRISTDGTRLPEEPDSESDGPVEDPVSIHQECCGKSFDSLNDKLVHQESDEHGAAKGG